MGEYGETGITRRWLDKVLVGFVIASVALVGLVWGTLAAQVKEAAQLQKDHEKRITVTEGDVKSIKETVGEIKSDVKSILREVKK